MAAKHVTRNDGHPPSESTTNAEPLRFPQSAMDWQQYDGARLFAAFVFLLSAIYFVYGFFAPQSWFGWVVSHIPLIGSVFDLSCILWRLSLLALGYFLLWFTFDRKAITGYAMAALPFFFAALYWIAPIDFIPDMVPVMGQVDDLTICSGSLLIGSKLWRNAREQNALRGRVSAALRRGDEKDALRLLLEQQDLN